MKKWRLSAVYRVVLPLISGVRSTRLARHCFAKTSTSGYFHLIRNLAALISLAFVFSGSFALSIQSVEAEAKTSRKSSGIAINYFVPPPPPYIPAMVPSAMVMTNAQAVTADTAKTSRKSSRIARNYFVPPPPPYTPSIVPSAMVMTNARAVVTADADDAVVEKPVNRYSQYIFTRNAGDMPQVVQLHTYLSYHPGVETRIREHIDCFDSEISSHEKEIGKLLNL